MEKGAASPSSIKNTIMTWLFPSLVSIIGYIIYQDVAEIKADVKLLMAQSNVDKTRIDNLERIIYKTTIADVIIETPNPPNKKSGPLKQELVAILPTNKYSPQDEETANWTL